jgi:succinate dehydrogenase/fumarate reductase cytochrome b subunit
MRHRATWVNLQRALGLGPLTLYAAYHLWLNWPALAGREAWLLRVRSHSLGLWLGVAVVAVLALHALLGVWNMLRAAPQENVERRSRRFQALTGALLLGFVIYHLAQVWPPSVGAHATPANGYERLWHALGMPLALGGYVLGCAALAFHLAHGWVCALERMLPSALRLATRLAAGAAGFALFFLYLQLVGWFALGEAVVPLSQPGASEQVAPR